MFDPDAAIYPFPPEPTLLNIDGRAYCREKIKRLPKGHSAMMVVHYCTGPKIQQLAKETGGCISDSLEMTRFGTKHPASMSLAAGVRLMGETTKILSPEKTVLMPTLQAGCSLDLGCPVEEFNVFCGVHPDRTVVVCANTSAAVKTRVDQMVTSSITAELINHLDSLDEKIIWTPDKHLGCYAQKQTGADILCRQGTYIVHDEFRTQALARLQEEYPDAAILIHSELPQVIVEMTSAVGSTGQLIAAAKTLPHQRLIVATDRGIFYEMQQAMPNKELLEASTASEGATYCSCAHCPWMAMNGLQVTAEALELERGNHEVCADERLLGKTLVPLNRMLDFAVILRG